MKKKDSGAGERKIAATHDLVGEPIHFAGEEITRLEFRRPKTGDLRVIDESDGDVGSAISLVARLVDLPEEVIDTLDPEDFAAASEIVDTLFASLGKKGSRKRSRSRKASAKASRRTGATR